MIVDDLLEDLLFVRSHLHDAFVSSFEPVSLLDVLEGLSCRRRRCYLRHKDLHLVAAYTTDVCGYFKTLFVYVCYSLWVVCVLAGMTLIASNRHWLLLGIR